MSRLPTKEALLKWVDEQQQLDAREALILTKLAAYADAAMESWAAIATLARQGRSSERKVQYVLRDFEAAGLIQRTGRKHRIPNTTRDVPVYVFAGFLADFGEADAMGAQRAPIPTHGRTAVGGMGAQGVHPHKEPIEPTLPSGSDARGREAAFGRLEAAYPKRGLGFTHRDRAWQAFNVLLDEKLDPDDLVAAAARYAADKGAAAKRQDLGLDHWLHDRRFRAWWPEPELAFEDTRPTVSQVTTPHAAPVEDQAVWRRVADQLAAGMTVNTYDSWVRPCVLCAHGGQLYLVALSSSAAVWLKDNRWRSIAAAWASTDPRRRPLTLISKLDFERVTRQPEGATS